MGHFPSTVLTWCYCWPGIDLWVDQWCEVYFFKSMSSLVNSEVNTRSTLTPTQHCRREVTPNHSQVDINKDQKYQISKKLTQKDEKKILHRLRPLCWRPTVANARAKPTQTSDLTNPMNNKSSHSWIESNQAQCDGRQTKAKVPLASLPPRLEQEHELEAHGLVEAPVSSTSPCRHLKPGLSQLAPCTG